MLEFIASIVALCALAAIALPVLTVAVGAFFMATDWYLKLIFDDIPKAVKNWFDRRR